MKKLLIISLSIALVGCQKHQLDQLSETFYVRNNDADMPAYVYGNGASGKFIILIHGGPGGHGLEYRFGEYSKMLEEKYAVVYWDQRGQGMSQGQYLSDSLNIGVMADDLKALILTVKKRYGEDHKIILLGHSWGGMLGTYFMVDSTNQALVDGWIESDGAHDMPKLEKLAIQKFIDVGTEMIMKGKSTKDWSDDVDWVTKLDTNYITRDEAIELNRRSFKIENNLISDDYITADELVLPKVFGPTNFTTSYVSGRFTNLFLSEEVDTTALTSQLYKITKPSLFLWGEYDFVAPFGLGTDAMNLVSSANKKLVIFHNSGHSPMYNEGKEFATEVIDFVDGL